MEMVFLNLGGLLWELLIKLNIIYKSLIKARWRGIILQNERKNILDS